MSFFEAVGLAVFVGLAVLGGMLFAYSTLLGARIIWRRLTGGE